MQNIPVFLRCNPNDIRGAGWHTRHRRENHRGEQNGKETFLFVLGAKVRVPSVIDGSDKISDEWFLDWLVVRIIASLRRYQQDERDDTCLIAAA
jgi:hypothetical protein